MALHVLIHILSMKIPGDWVMDVGTVFVNNRTQAVRLPVGIRFPENVKKVVVRIVGKDRVLSSVENWIETE
jgi:virulence-associated protein VagC